MLKHINLMLKHYRKIAMRAFIFPGQGSQAVGMGQSLASASPIAHAVFQEVDEALEMNLFQLMSEGPEDKLTLTENAQPAIMANAIACLRVLEAETGWQLADKADFVAGHSLGEYSALCAAGAFDLATTARLLRLRGQAMQAAAPLGTGAMAALLGAGVDAVEALLAEVAKQSTAPDSADSICVVANDNDPTQLVISGHKIAVDRAIALAKEHGCKRAVPLPVSAPFHCPLMKPAAQAMEAALAENPPQTPSVPLVANVTAAPLQDAATIARFLVEQVTKRVRWRESVQTMHKAGVREFIELGAKPLGAMVKRSVGADAEVAVASLISYEDITSFAKAMEF